MALRKRFVGSTAALVLASFLTACDGGVDFERRLGVLDPDTEFELLESYPVGATIEVEFTTVGLDGCFAGAGTEIDRLSRGYLLRPYDLRNVNPQVACTADTLDISHSAILQFRSPGENSVRIHGWDLDGDSLFVLTVPITIE